MDAKSYLCSALVYHACQSGYKVLYANTAKLMGQLKMAKAKGTIITEMKRIERMDLLILDDFESFSKLKAWINSFKHISTVLSRSGRMERRIFFDTQLKLIDLVLDSRD